MKKILLSLTIVAFAVCAQAGDSKATCKDAAAGGCCSGKTCEQVKTSSQSTGGCCSAAKPVAKSHVTKSQLLMSPKAAAEVASR